MKFVLIFFVLFTSVETSRAATPALTPVELVKVDLALNWKPEPEFGGFYEASLNKIYEKNGIAVSILPGGAGQPVAQMVAAKKVKFGISAADDHLLARGQGAKLVAIYAVYQSDPHGFMVHPERKFKTLKEVFQSEGTIALQKGLPFNQWIEKVYAPIKAKIVPYTGGITSFLKDPQYSQQCFVTSEPIAARRKNKPSKVFLVSESGFDSYLAVVIVHEDTLKNEPELVKKFVAATREGWKNYLKDPHQTNTAMLKINGGSDLETFKESAQLQIPYIETVETKKHGLGTMTEARWKKLAKQMEEIKLIPAPRDITQAFKNP